MRERKRLNTRLWNWGRKREGEKCAVCETGACASATVRISAARTCAGKASRRYARGHRECFIFSGLSNRRGRYVHALAAINDLISVSFHLPDYGQNSAVRRSGRGLRRGYGQRREPGVRRRARGVRFSPRQPAYYCVFADYVPGLAAICRLRVT